MRNMISLAIAGGLIAAATPALAQSVEQAPFTGPHVEALAGYDKLQTGSSNRVSDSRDGLAYGIGAGYDVQFGGAIVGVEGEVMGSSTKSRNYNFVAPGDGSELRARRDLYIGARVGFAATPTTLIYLKGGYTNAGIQARSFNGTGGYFQQNSTLDGYRVGAGVEQKFNLLGPSGFAKLEYRYSNYSNLNIGQFNADVDLDRHQVVAGVGVRF